MTKSTNKTVAKHATQTGVLDLGKRNLIGIVNTPQKKRVLVRAPGGKILTLSLGDTLAPGKITAISDDAVMIDTSLGPRKFKMPKPAA